MIARTNTRLRGHQGAVASGIVVPVKNEPLVAIRAFHITGLTYAEIHQWMPRCATAAVTLHGYCLNPLNFGGLN